MIYSWWKSFSTLFIGDYITEKSRNKKETKEGNMLF